LLKKSVGGGRDTASLIFAIPTVIFFMPCPYNFLEKSKDESAKRSEKVAFVLTKKALSPLPILLFTFIQQTLIRLVVRTLVLLLRLGTTKVATTNL
jgi:hypothetical protein